MAKSPITLPSVELQRPSAQPGRQLKGLLHAGEVLLGGMIAEYVRPSLVKLYCHAGFDFVFFEYEHGFLNPTDLVDAVLCARDNGMPVIAKTPQLERAEVAKLLDCGVVGIQLPRTETRADVEKLLSYLKFPPRGTRAVAPSLGNTTFQQATGNRGWITKTKKPHWSYISKPKLVMKTLRRSSARQVSTWFISEQATSLSKWATQASTTIQTSSVRRRRF